MAVKKKKKVLKRIIITLIILAIVVLGVATFVLSSRGANAQIEETPQIANLTTYYTFSGNVESKNTSTILADKPEQISTIKYAEGTKVKKDQTIFVNSLNEAITSNIAGTITKIYVEKNQQVTAGTKLADIVDLDALQVTIKVDEYDLPAVTLNKDVEVSINAINKTITGKISKISKIATVQNSVAYFTAVIDLGKDSDIKVGMSCDAKMINQQVSNAVTITMNAVQFDINNAPYVTIKDPTSKSPKQVYITVGINDGTRVEVKSGLATTDTVVYPKPVQQATSALLGGRSGSSSNGSSSSSGSQSGGTNTNSSSIGG
jgi:HlyD family secretion protein